MAEWNARLPSLSPWRDAFLVGRAGPIVSGVCLDGVADPTRYRPTFFVHGLLEEWPVLTLSYGAFVEGGPPVDFRLGADVGPIVASLCSNVEAAPSIGTLDEYVRHVVRSYAGQYGPSHPRPERFLLDVLGTVAHVHGQAVEQWLDAGGMQSVRAPLDRDFADRVRSRCRGATQAVADRNAKQLGLALHDRGLSGSIRDVGELALAAVRAVNTRTVQGS